MRFVEKYVQDMSNSTKANTRTLPEEALDMDWTVSLQEHIYVTKTSHELRRRSIYSMVPAEIDGTCKVRLLGARFCIHT